MTDSKLCYSIGALLYCPATNNGIVDSLIRGKFETPFSLAFCLEDTIRDDRVSEAEATLSDTLHRLRLAMNRKTFYMPYIFIRVRNSRQMLRLYHALGEDASLVTGFAAPKFCTDNAESYIEAIKKLNSEGKENVYLLPILESPALISLADRCRLLYELKAALNQIERFVLNIRVGGNDLNHAFGFRRSSRETIYDILPIAHILSDIMTVFGMDYVVSGPVWEYYGGEGWDTGLAQELKLDRLNGFIGKTVIHPNQIPIVNRSLAVSRKDYDDARSILNWNDAIPGLVAGSGEGERMNEFKTHHNWAMKIILLHEIYGIAG